MNQTALGSLRRVIVKTSAICFIRPGFFGPFPGFGLREKRRRWGVGEPEESIACDIVLRFYGIA
jgi:hypothetical protein